MSSIDAVIAQARRPGAFAERRRFSVAKTQAIQKLRRFALADPFAYVLELIQSAVANGAEFIDVGVDEATMTLSYVGGGIPGEALARLFDFLFAAKDRADLGYVRELALGVNALMLFAPTRIVIESGDGTPQGTTRVELHGGGEKFDVGRPSHVLSGTFVRAEGMDRGRLLREMKLSRDPEQLHERALIEARCLAAPVPIVFNGEVLFGYSSMRVPSLYGYPRSLAVDEGDLYGTLVCGAKRPEFTLLTRGVVIETVEHELVPGGGVAGIICFDGLRKTADHARVVRDERLEELWLRLRPHAQQLVSGRKVEGVHAARLHGGPALPTAELRALLRERKRVVAIAPDLRGLPLRSALAIAQELDAALIEVPPGQVRALRILGGEAVRVFEPDLANAREVEFYLKIPTSGRPERPWLVQPVQVPPLSTGALIELILAGAEEVGELRATLQAVLGDSGEIKATVYTPAAAEDGLFVELRMLGRLLTRAAAAAAVSGHVLVVELPDLPPGALLRIGGEAVADALARHAAGALREAGRRVLDGLSPETCTPGHGAARRALATVARGAVLRLRGGAQPGAEAVLLEAGPPGVDLLGLPLLETLAGERLGVRELLRRASETSLGLVYGAIEAVPPDLTGLDAGKIVRLDPESERLLVALVGESVYVRVDARQACADHRGVLCRDLALGLRAYPEFPLLVEGVDPSGWSAWEREVCLASLLGQLVAVVEGRSPALVGLGEADAAELRRHALRHLQWYALHASGALEAVAHVPLAREIGGPVIGADALLGRIAEGGAVWAHCWQGPFPGPGAPEWPRAWVVEVTPFVYLQLAGLPGVVAGFDFEVGVEDVPEGMAEATGPRGYLASAPVRCPGIEGLVGVPATAAAAPAVLVYDAAGRRVHVFAELAREFGVVGALRSTRPMADADDVREVGAAITAAAEAAIVALLDAKLEDPRALEVLVDFAGGQVKLMADPAGRVRAVVTGAAAGQVLARPLFTGPWVVPRSGWRIVQAACEALGRGEPVAPEGGPALRRFVGYLQPGRVVRPASRGVPQVATTPASVGEVSSAQVVAALERWLHALRPDDEQVAWEARGRVVFVSEEQASQMGEELALVGGSADEWQIGLNGSHWLPVWLRETGTARALAWLLLGCYEAVNEAFPGVTGHHEQEFQRRVAEALVRGELTLV